MSENQPDNDSGKDPVASNTGKQYNCYACGKQYTERCPCDEETDESRDKRIADLEKCNAELETSCAILRTRDNGGHNFLALKVFELEAKLQTAEDKLAAEKAMSLKMADYLKVWATFSYCVIEEEFERDKAMTSKPTARERLDLTDFEFMGLNVSQLRYVIRFYQTKTGDIYLEKINQRMAEGEKRNV